MSEVNPSYKVIADHLRSSSFLIADGVMPSNEGRGYVLRRIMRRAMRHIHMLGSKDLVMYKLVPVLVKQMGDAFPELKRAEATIIDTLKTEEERFRATLSKGMEILNEELTKLKKGEKFSGSVAFKLYDTYGFPLDLTQDILREKKIEVDVEGFNSDMEIQKKRSSENWTGSGEVKDKDIYFNLKAKFPKTEFLGYKATKADAKILCILKDGVEVSEVKSGDKNVEIILDQTPFYATSGGQRGDDGNFILKSEDAKLISYSSLKNVIDIFETKKMAGDLFIHGASEIKGNFKVGDNIVAIVNNRNRQFRAINHSATHLLHFVLKQILGNHITQKGSNVDAESFTFDFNHNKPLTQEEIYNIEDLVNFYIRQNSSVETNIMKLDDARNAGAMALFGEKYDDVVRVLSMGKSVELCGGTHANNTGNIGLFKIICEKGVAAGIRRIEALTGYFAFEHFRIQERKLDALLDTFKIRQAVDNFTTAQNVTKQPVKFHSDKKGFDELHYFKDEETGTKVIDAEEELYLQSVANMMSSIAKEQVDEIKALQKEIEKLKKEKLAANTNFTIEKVGEINLISHFFDGADANSVREITTDTKNKKEYQSNSIILFFGKADNKVSAVLAVSPDLTSKFNAGKLIPSVAEKISGKGGGGKPDMAMCGGTNQNGIANAVLALKQIIE